MCLWQMRSWQEDRRCYLSLQGNSWASRLRLVIAVRLITSWVGSAIKPMHRQQSKNQSVLAPSVQLDQASHVDFHSSPPRKVARYAEMPLLEATIDKDELQFDKNPIHVCKLCHDITDESSCVRCCVCVEILHERCVGTENLHGQLVLCQECSIIFKHSSDGVINPNTVSAISKLHSVACLAMRQCALEVLASSSLTRDTLAYYAHALNSPLLELAVTMIPSPTTTPT